MVRIEKWAVVYVSGDIYTPPEKRDRALFGAVYGHPKFEEGFLVNTSDLIGGSAKTDDGHVVKTKSRDYLLGEPDPAYLRWLEQNGIKFDPEQPIKDANA
ncbi:hypothetical protein BH10CYA1_BH10CYA1_41990 [soil metagenome]